MLLYTWMLLFMIKLFIFDCLNDLGFYIHIGANNAGVLSYIVKVHISVFIKYLNLNIFVYTYIIGSFYYHINYRLSTEAYKYQTRELLI